MKVYIQTNKNQLIGALVSKYLFARAGFDAEILNIQDIKLFSKLDGARYLRNGRFEKYKIDDLQSFTLLRFWPESNCDGDYLIVDPDVFPVRLGLNDIDSMRNKSVDGLHVVPGSVPGDWRSSVMFRFRKRREEYWNFDSLIESIFNGEIDYNDVILLRIFTKPITPLPEFYNHYDNLSENTIMLHTTARNTQPWKTGLKIDFINHKLSHFQRLRQQYLVRPRYLKHPCQQVEDFFIKSLAGAMRSGYVSTLALKQAIKDKTIRQDIELMLKGL